MTFNFNKIGKSIATINGGKYSNKKLFVSDNCYNGDDEYVKEFTQFNIPDEGKFQQIPDKKKEREILSRETMRGVLFFVFRYFYDTVHSKIYSFFDWLTLKHVFFSFFSLA